MNVKVKVLLDTDVVTTRSEVGWGADDVMVVDVVSCPRSKVAILTALMSFILSE